MVVMSMNLTMLRYLNPKGARLSQGKPNQRVMACVVLVGLQLTSVQRTDITLNVPLQKQVPSLLLYLWIPHHRAVMQCPSISDAVSETGGIDSDDYMMYDLCTCGSSGRAHKRDCLMNFRRRRLPQSPGESKPDTARSPSPSNPGPPSVSPEPECVVIDDVSPPPTEEARPQIKVGDYVSVHSGRSHLPCRVVGEFDGRYQLYCSKGVLDTTFSRAEVIPMARCTPIPMEEWRQAPKVSLRSAAR